MATTKVSTQGTSASLVLHSTTVPRQILVFTSDNFRYLTLVQRDWWWYCSDWTCERFSFWPHQGLNLWISSPDLFNSRGIAGGIVLIGERFPFWPHQGLNQGPLDL